MGTTFSILPGYRSTKIATTTITELIVIAKSISIEEIRQKSIEYGVSENEIDEYLEPYISLPTEDLTCYFTDSSINQCATGVSPERIIKEQIRKAFAMLLLDKAFKIGRNVNFISA